MTQDEGFLEAIVADPEDDVVRLVYADWLDDHGRPERAEFIRLQIELARLRADWLDDRRLPEHAGLFTLQSEVERLRTGDPRQKALEDREAELLTEYGGQWLHPLQDLLPEGDCEPVFHRGFVQEITFWGRGGAHCLLAHAAELFRHAPVCWVRLLPAGGFVVGPFPWDRRPKEDQDRLSPQDLEAVCGLPELDRLTLLDLSGTLLENPSGGAPLIINNRIGNRATRLLTNTPYLAGLRTLLLRDNVVGDEGALALAASPYLAWLTTLDLAHNQLSDAVKEDLKRRLGERLVLE
jgi:uncharacterized protein (TIGR02996 family)